VDHRGGVYFSGDQLSVSSRLPLPRRAGRYEPVLSVVPCDPAAGDDHCRRSTRRADPSAAGDRGMAAQHRGPHGGTNRGATGGVPKGHTAAAVRRAHDHPVGSRRRAGQQQHTVWQCCPRRPTAACPAATIAGASGGGVRTAGSARGRWSSERRGHDPHPTTHRPGQRRPAHVSGPRVPDGTGPTSA
jgi:hypothetical protein